eukprot:evm.model.scf_78.16 EVM.evm.TU.scf_78.16   scf_78:102-4819(-)
MARPARLRHAFVAALLALLAAQAASQTITSLSDSQTVRLACEEGGTSTEITSTVTGAGDVNSTTTVKTSTSVGGVTTSSSSTTLTSVGGSVTAVVGGVPFDVQGTDTNIDLCVVSGGLDNRDALRPEGDWDPVVEAAVNMKGQDIWNILEDYGQVLARGFGNLALTIRPLDGESEFIVDLNTGEMVQFEVVETNKEEFYHIAVVTFHTPGVFEGFSIVGSRILFWIAPADGGNAEQSVLEFAFEGKIDPEDLSGAASILIESLFQEMLSNLESFFGEDCTLLQFSRTLEGDCNNLKYPRRGASGLGLEYLKDAATGMDGQCFTTSAVGPTSWEACLFSTATASRSSNLDTAKLEWEALEELSSGTVRFKWSSGSDCELLVEFRCAGEDAMVVSDPSEGFEFIGPQCGRIHGWLYSPQACRFEPGDDGVATNPVGYTDLFWTTGQFLDHDLDLTPESQIAEDKQPGFTDTRAVEEFPIFVPEGDFYFGGTEELEFKRSVQIPDEGNPVKFVNKHSAYIDLGMVYGQDFARANALRTHKDGLLKLHGAGFLPKNKLSGPDALGAKLSNAPDADDRFFVAGDIRANEQVILLSMHTLWAREHNQVATELKAIFPDFGDKQLFETARAIVISCWQSIVYTEYLPLLIGSAAAPGDYKYDEEIDPGVTAFFSTVAYRYGHSMVPSQLWRVPAGGSTVLVPLRDAFFNPELVETYDIGPWLRGAALHECRNIDDK